ncbi:hypothetical protein DFJ74DRAFT_708914 [Hyaloraphidium curvatum]|nr:hypothetical protein DFJ74DRAFT_708914 [Hyaloraphidium curvatum]
MSDLPPRDADGRYFFPIAIRICSSWPADAEEPVFGDQGPRCGTYVSDEAVPEGKDGYQTVIQMATASSREVLLETLGSRPWFCIACGVPTTNFVGTNSIIPPWPFEIVSDTFPVCRGCEHAVIRRCNARSKRSVEPVRDYKFKLGIACRGCRDFTKDRTTFQRCSRCKAAYDCSADCFRRDWTKHKEVCRPPTKPARDG